MILDNIIRLCQEKHISVASLEKQCGFGNATIRSWSGSDPGAKKLKVVADFFGVTVDELMKEES